MLHNPRRPDPLLQLGESSRVLPTPWALKDKPGPSETALPHCSRVPKTGERGFSASRPLALVELRDPSAASSTPSLHIAEERCPQLQLPILQTLGLTQGSRGVIQLSGN